MSISPAPWRLEERGIVVDQTGSAVAGIKSYDDGRLIAAAPLGLDAACEAYHALLQLPHAALRLRSQHALCLLRDFIAQACGTDSQTVQEDYEERAILTLGSLQS